jgi:hypothetical protein
MQANVLSSTRLLGSAVVLGCIGLNIGQMKSLQDLHVVLGCTGLNIGR